MMELFLVDIELADGTRVRRELWSEDIEQANKEAHTLVETLDPDWTFFHLFRS